MNKENQNRNEGLDLKKLGTHLERIDQDIITLLAERMEVSKQVEEYKSAQIPILRIQIENERLKKIEEWAKKKNLNPSFAQAIFYLIIAESCRVQIDQLQSSSNKINSP